jgi:hypothetical protein
MLQKEKLFQAISILNELNIDMWLTLGRETEMNNDLLSHKSKDGTNI